jgi:hypothetical protein
MTFFCCAYKIKSQACRPRGCHGMAWGAQILADQLTLKISTVGGLGGDYALQIKTGTSRFSDLPTALSHVYVHILTLLA